MKLIQKGNRQLRVDDVRAAELIKAGYVELDPKTGKPIKVETEQEKAEKAIKAENEALKAENAALKEQVAALTADKQEEQPPKEEKPKGKKPANE